VAERVAGQATDHWNDQVAVDRLVAAGATVVHGVGHLDGPGKVVVDLPTSSEQTVFLADKIVVNPGTRPAVPPIPGIEATPFWTNRDAVQVTELPSSLVVIGGGPIGCELVQVFSRFGVQVTVVQHGDRLLEVNEPEASALLQEVFADEGIRVLTGVDATGVSYADGQFTITLSSGETLAADKLLVAAGRRPNLQDLGLDTVGIDPSVRTLDVDDRMRVKGVAGLWAIGDVTGKGAFTHVSMYQYAVARRDILGEEGPPATYHALPHCTFTDPEIGGVGMTEAQARDAGLAVRTGITRLEESTRGFTHGPGGRGLVKVVEDADRGVLVGATVVGPAGGEILGYFLVAVHAAVPVETLRSMIYTYPTFHRAIESALADLS
jgi:pyruvate/2-oxoglutarate dehydrogenase complex dihydrolipoamide dehydrogenase (E3) component